MPSRRLEEITTWQKPFTFSASIRRRMDWWCDKEVRDRKHSSRQPWQWYPGQAGCRVRVQGADCGVQVPTGCPGLCAPRQAGNSGLGGLRPDSEWSWHTALCRAEWRVSLCQGSDRQWSSN